MTSKCFCSKYTSCKTVPPGIQGSFNTTMCPTTWFLFKSKIQLVLHSVLIMYFFLLDPDPEVTTDSNGTDPSSGCNGTTPTCTPPGQQGKCCYGKITSNCIINYIKSSPFWRSARAACINARSARTSWKRWRNESTYLINFFYCSIARQNKICANTNFYLIQFLTQPVVKRFEDDFRFIIIKWVQGYSQ